MISLLSWLDFRWVTLSRWTQLSLSSCQLRQRSWPRSRKSVAHISGPHPELQKLWAAPYLLRRSAEREDCHQAETGPLDSWCHRLGLPIARRATRSVSSSYALAHGASLADICRAAGWAIPSQDFTVSALSQSLPVCWVTGKWREELAGHDELELRHSSSPGYASTFFPPPVSSPDGKPWWSSSCNPGSQTGWNSLTPGPVLGLARPGLQSAPVLG